MTIASIRKQSAAPTPAFPAVAAAPLVAVSGGGGDDALNIRIGDWFERTFGRAAMPVAAVGAGAIGAGIGFLTLGPVGAVVGGVAAGWLGALVVGLRP